LSGLVIYGWTAKLDKLSKLFLEIIEECEYIYGWTAKLDKLSKLFLEIIE
jgi:hypothetical protein